MADNSQPRPIDALVQALLGYADFAQSANAAAAQRGLHAIGRPVNPNEYYQPITRAGDAAYGLVMPSIVEHRAQPLSRMTPREQRAGQHTPEGMLGDLFSILMRT